jgi:tetratricopeptide (TPR) repeat protein
MGCLIALAGAEGALWRKHARQLQSHVEALAAWKVDKMFAAEPPVLVTRVLVKCGWMLHQMRSDAKLFMLMKKIFTCLGLERANVERPWMGVYDLAVRNLVNHGKVKVAIPLMEKVVKIREQSLAEDHPARLASQHALAGAYRANGQVKEAAALLEKVVKIEEQSLAEDHPSRLASQHALAGAYQANGQVKEAVALLEKVVKIEEQSLAEDHPDRLASLHNLAIYMWKIGIYKASLDMMARVVEIRRQALHESHPARQGSEDWLCYFEEEMAELEVV